MGFYIGERFVGDGAPPLLIAEIGINHGGSLDTAIAMVDSAAEAGIEVIKHQTHIAVDEMTYHAKAIIPEHADKNIYEIIDECSLDESEEIELMDYVSSKEMIFISTPFSRNAALRLKKMNIPAFKIGSGECNNIPLVRLIASFGKPVILSTGMNNIDSISRSVEVLRSASIPFALLHTTNIYPTPHHLVRLNSLNVLRNFFPDAVIGLSDHTIDNFTSLAAVAMGAQIIERHFTDSKERTGPDISSSMSTEEAREILLGISAIYDALGGEKKPVEEELPTMKFAFASVVIERDICAGEVFTEENLWVRRPGTGDFLAAEFDSIIGLRAKKDLVAGEQLKISDVIRE